MPKTGIGLMARFPLPGRVKTRLAAEIGTNEALAVYRQMLGCAVAQVCSLDRRRVLRTAFVTPEEWVSQFCELYPGFDAYRPQVGNDLGARMLQALRSLQAEGNTRRSLLIGADIPGITDVLLQEAIERLATCDCVLGPTTDGGYYLIGLKGPPAARLFSGLRWGSNEVLAHTRVVINQLELQTHELVELRDVDSQEDLKVMRAAGFLPDAAGAEEGG